MHSVGKAGKGRMETMRRVEEVSTHNRSEESKKTETTRQCNAWTMLKKIISSEGSHFRILKTWAVEARNRT